MRRLSIIVGLTSLMALLLVACGGGSAAATSAASPTPTATLGSAANPEPQQGEVQANDELAFAPAQLAVSVGDTVQWTNVGDIPHTVTFSDSSIPNAKLLEGGAVFQVTFRQAGTYSYVCKFHPGMEGTVTVQ